MNWRRGFFRAWVLLTIMWTLAIAFLMSSSIMNPFVSDRGFHLVDGKFQPLPHYTGEYEIAEQQVAKKQLVKVFFPSMPGVYFFGPVDAEEVMNSTTGDEAASYAQSLYGAAVEDARWVSLKTALAIGLIPPSIVLVLGLGLAWVLSGFRHTRASR